jgi:ribosome biogenesis GTPase
MISDRYGWNNFFAEKIKDDNFLPARIINQQLNTYTIICNKGEKEAKVSGKLLYNTTCKDDFPVVGDWVLIKKVDSDIAIIDSIIPRKNFISRNIASGRGDISNNGNIEQQIIAANIDYVFLVTSFDRDFNLRRIERYLSIIYSSGSSPVIILNKADLCDDIDNYIMRVEEVAVGVPIHAISAINDNDEIFDQYLKPKLTSVLIGSSGVGKSTIINLLLHHEKQKVKEVSSAVNKGRHTTTHRQLFLMPTGGIIIDNPGMREIQLFDDEKGVESLFSDIAALTSSCKFTNCSHDTEPGCAIKKAIRAGVLSKERYYSYLKLKKENDFFEAKKTKSQSSIEKNKWKEIHKRRRVIISTNPKHRNYVKRK